MRPRERELRRGVVIEGRAFPLRGRMTDAAILRESGGHVIRVFAVIEVGQVATDARCRQSGKYVVFVAVGASQRNVRPCERELRSGAVIERRALPLNCRMADTAILRESGRQVIRVSRAVKVLQMAALACSRRRGKRHPVEVTLSARDRGVGSGQRKLAQVVIEPCVLPAGSCVASGAIGRKVPRQVIWVFGGFEILEMAAVTVQRRACKPPGNVALVAAECDMGPGQRELRHCTVVERSARPRSHVVACLTIMRKTRRSVIGILDRSEIPGMTGETVGGGACKPVADMAVNAFQTRVRADQRESRKPGMIESRRVP